MTPSPTLLAPLPSSPTSTLLLALALTLALVLLPASHATAASTPRQEQAIAAVESGASTIAFADAWGFNPDDATDALQAAIDSKARTVIVPFTGSPWIVRPIRLRGDLDLVFEAGVLVLAKAGAFLGGGDTLFRAQDATNITIRGHGATLRMRKADYQNPPYPRAEWRMGLAFLGCRNVLVDGLRIESSGGDGIYVGSSRANRWSENVTLRNCVCHDNHRQGISIISAVHLLVENCTLSGTQGTAPEAGIDLEPDEPDERLIDCVIRNCVITDNAGNGILVWLKPLTSASTPVSIRFENCHVRLNHPTTPAPIGWSGISVGEISDDGPRGLIEFIRCTSENTGREAVRLTGKSARGARVRFIECRWRNTWTAHHRAYGGPRSPILIHTPDPARCQDTGGIEFIDCRVVDNLDTPVVRFEDLDGTASLRDVRGTLHIEGMPNPRLRLGPLTRDVDLRLLALAPSTQP